MTTIRKCENEDCQKSYRAAHGNSGYCPTCNLNIKTERSPDFFTDRREKRRCKLCDLEKVDGY